MTRKIGMFVGSLRKESFTRKLAMNLQDLSPSSLALEVVEIGELPLYNQDMDDGGTVPQAVTTFREKVKSLDGVLFLTPEYNRSVPGVLKNAIDVGSRPYGKSAWQKKPGAVISVSPGALAAFGANHHLRQSLVFLDVPCMQQPEAYLGGVSKLLDASGKLTNDATRDFLKQFMTAYAAWVERHHA